MAPHGQVTHARARAHVYLCCRIHMTWVAGFLYAATGAYAGRTLALTCARVRSRALRCVHGAIYAYDARGGPYVATGTWGTCSHARGLVLCM